MPSVSTPENLAYGFITPLFHGSRHLGRATWPGCPTWLPASVYYITSRITSHSLLTLSDTFTTFDPLRCSSSSLEAWLWRNQAPISPAAKTQSRKNRLFRLIPRDRLPQSEGTIRGQTPASANQPIRNSGILLPPCVYYPPLEVSDGAADRYDVARV